MLAIIDDRPRSRRHRPGRHQPQHGAAPAAAEMWLGKPVIAINMATYWHALRQNKIVDKIPGHGRLLGNF
jgi:hypothetical protein